MLQRSARLRPFSLTVQAYLAHLRDAGFTGAPLPFAVDMARRYHEDSRVSPELDPVFRKLWEDGARDELPRAEAWLREAAPAITARLEKPSDG